MSRNTFLLCVWLIILPKWMNFVVIEPCFYSKSSILWIWGAMATFTRFLLKITANLIDKLCYYATCMDEPSLNYSKKLWFLTLFKCALVNLLQNVVRSLLSARGPNDFGKMIILIIVYYKGGYHAVNNMKLLKNIQVNNMELIPTKVGCNYCNLPFPVGKKKETLLMFSTKKEYVSDRSENFSFLLIKVNLSRHMKNDVHPAKAQSSLGICPVW